MLSVAETFIRKLKRSLSDSRSERYLLLIAYCLLLLVFPASAQHTIMRSYNINDGLVSNQIKGFYQDRNGFMWIMTWEGLSRYDGYAFRNYTLAEGIAHPLINALIEGTDDKLFISENDGSVDVMIQGEINKELRTKFERPFNQFITESSGRILAPSDENGIFVFDQGSFTTLNTSGMQLSVNDVIEYDEYFIVCGTKGGVMLHDHTFINQWTDTLNDYKCILKDHLNRIWVGTSNGLRWVDLSSDPAKRFDLISTSYEKTSWSHWDINDIIQTSEGSIWLAAFGGLVQIKPDQSWRLFNRRDGLPNDNITSVFEDKDGFIWIGTDQGMAQLDTRNTIDIFTISEDLPNSMVLDIQPIQNGAAYVVSNTPAVYKINVGHPRQSIAMDNYGNAYQFLKVSNDTLVSTIDGYYKVKDTGIKKWTDLPYSRNVLSLSIEGSLISALGGKITMVSSKESLLDTSLNDQIFAMAYDTDKGIWVGSLNKGLFRIKLKKNSAGQSAFEWLDANKYLPEKTIRSLHADSKGNIWVGTRYSGLVQLRKDSSGNGYATRVFNRNDGFISDFIKSIDSDEESNIWVGTSAGIEKLIPTGEDYRVFSFSRVLNYFAVVQKIVVGPGHTLWCTTTSGVDRIRDSSYDTIAPTSVFITSVSTVKNILLDPRNVLPFNLKYNQNYLGITFSSNDFINGKQLKYSYRLKGSQDTLWSKPLPVHTVSFANLLPGDYRFEVKVKGWNGIFGEETFFSFKILPPFWQQAWFVILFILSILGLVFSFYRYRIRQLQRIQDVRNRIASDLHDEIGSSLTHVNILSEIGRKTFHAEEKPLQLFKRIGEEVQSSSEALDDIIWSVSSRVDTAEDLISRMRRYASELFDAKGITFELLVENLDENQTLGLELRRDFYLVYKELLRNIIRHAEATRVNMRVLREDQFLSLVVADNGHGFDTELSSDRHGLKSIKGRVSKWKGQISIESSDQGTTIKVGLPLKKNI
ncbi:MAG TPA: two-component regulator propeller domain-containing protein [Saprospiraceae bacterium]|nr:two-component regulator propeller domain-containing protein [Saprospiraceae bacterium]